MFHRGLSISLFIVFAFMGCDSENGHDHDDHDHGGTTMGGAHAMGGTHPMGGAHAMGGAHTMGGEHAMGGGHAMGGEHAGHMGGHAMGGEHGGHMGPSCADSPTEHSMFMAGISQASTDGGFTLTIDSAEPMMPMQGNNTWQLSLTDGEGNTVDGATIVVTPTMPDHGHGTTPTSFTATAGEGAGQYAVGPITLQMPGVWRFTVEVTPAEGDADSVVLNFCAMPVPTAG